MNAPDLDFADRLAHLAAMLVALRQGGCTDDAEKEDLTDACMKLARALRDECFSIATSSEGAAS